MIEFTGSIFGAPAMQMRLESLDDDGTIATYSTKAVVRDPVGDHVYQRTVNVPKTRTNILGILQIALDGLPFEAQLCSKGLWVPSQDKIPLELL